MSLVDDATAGLREGPLVDLGGLLKPGGRREVEREIGRVATAGRHAHVVVAPLGEELGPLHEVWTRIGFDEGRDLLLLFDGRRWEARGWNLSHAAIDAALARAEVGLRQYYGRGLALAVAELDAAAGGRGEERRSGSSLASVALGVAGLGAAAAVGWVIARRVRRGGERRRTLAEARSSAEKVFADVLIAADEMPGPEAAALREKATRLRDQIDALAPPAVKQLPAKEESLTLAQLLQTENELEALRSSVLQAKRRS